MKKYIIIYFLLFISFLQFTLAQTDDYITEKKQQVTDTLESKESFQIGLRIDYNFVSEKTLINTDRQPKYESRIYSYDGNLTSPFSLYIPLHYNIDDFLSFEFRPGLIFAGDELSCYTLGFICYWHPVKTNFYLVAGLENTTHLNNFEPTQEPGIMSRVTGQVSGHNDDLFHTSAVIGAGYKFNRSVSMDISFRKPFKEQYGYTQIEDQKKIIDLPNGKYPMTLYWMIRIGANFYF